ncbi:DMT family transporter [Microbacterium sp. W1N]|uniref:DMT family transporter n=1 Tax=Microbacterium festucae TaxID=2977531 RepID=UPI0021C1229B|nr:DMT family transporter [Microbacterium festucae]MCT9821092.1 DMT family transporter [Microbacterium festucae]
MPVWLAVGGAVLVGVLTALQARINGQLGGMLGDGFVAAAISFGSGLIALIVLSTVLPAGRRGFAQLSAGVRERRIPWWMLGGGAAGALTVATQGLAVAVIGVSLFTVGVVAGQTLHGLVLDRIGYGPAGVVAVTVPRVIGGALALGAVVVSLQGGALERVPLWMLLLPFAAGAGIAWQQATNGRLRQRVGTPLTATLVNFIGGTGILVVLAAVSVAVSGMPAALPTQPWVYLGGVIGVTYIFLSAALVMHTGVLLLGLGTVVGQLVTAFVLDALWPAPASPGWVLQLITIGIALASVVVATAPRRR